MAEWIRTGSGGFEGAKRHDPKCSQWNENENRTLCCTKCMGDTLEGTGLIVLSGSVELCYH